MDHRKIKTTIVCLAMGISFLIAKAAFAQTPTDLGQIGGGEELGPWTDIGKKGTTIAVVALKFTFLLSRVISIMTVVAGLYFMFNIFIAAYGYLHAGGSDEKVKQSTESILHSVIGLIIVIAAYALVSLLGALLGFEILKPGKFIKELGPFGP